MKFPALVLALTALATGCLADDEEEVGSTSSEVMTYNRMTYNRMTYNRMTYNSLATNLTSSIEIVKVPLSTQVYSGSGFPASYLRQQLLDPGAREFMSYLVSCALPRGRYVKWTSPDETRREYFWGSDLALCPEWASGEASPQCQELVSACMLARNNAFGTKVAISLRGLDTHGDPIVEPTELVRPTGETSVESYQACSGSVIGSHRDCDWIPDYVGSCTPGDWVYLYDGACSGDMMLRACRGRGSCDADDSTLLGSMDHACGSGYLRFQCPGEGTFNVMKAAYRSTDTGTIDVRAWRATYPDTEIGVFDTREGAFFGNIFGGRFNQDLRVYTSAAGVVTYSYLGKRYPDATEISLSYRGTIFTEMYSCFSDEWDRGDAYAHRRICAGEDDEGCAATVVGACRGYHDFSSPLFKCTSNDSAAYLGDGDYDGCRDNLSEPRNGRMWHNPITVFLDNLCDVTGKLTCPY